MSESIICSVSACSAVQCTWCLWIVKSPNPMAAPTQWMKILRSIDFYLGFGKSSKIEIKLWGFKQSLAAQRESAVIAKVGPNWVSLSFKNHKATKNLFNSFLIKRHGTLIPHRIFVRFLSCLRTPLDSASPGRTAHNSPCVGWGDVFFSCTEEAQYPVPARL